MSLALGASLALGRGPGPGRVLRAMLDVLLVLVQVVLHSGQLYLGGGAVITGLGLGLGLGLGAGSGLGLGLG